MFSLFRVQTRLRSRFAQWKGVSLCAVSLACSKGLPTLDAKADLPGAPPTMAAATSCARDGLRPSAVPPAEGVWTYQAPGGPLRVDVLISPADVREGTTSVSRRVETVETAAGSALRNRVDTAVVRLDRLPAYGGRGPGASSTNADTSRSSQSAAVYQVTPRILVAAYESCSGVSAPAVRYLRREERGRVVIDAMLHREAETRDP